jgi:hypothetical protein
MHGLALGVFEFLSSDREECPRKLLDIDLEQDLTGKPANTVSR